MFTSRSRPILSRPRSRLALRRSSLGTTRLSPTRRHYAFARKLTRLRRSRNRRTPMIYFSQHLAIPARGPLMLRLRRRHAHVRIPSRSLLRS